MFEYRLHENEASSNLTTVIVMSLCSTDYQSSKYLYKMPSRILFVVFLSALAIFTTGCAEGEGKTTATASFTSHPRGGEFIEEVEAEFTLRRSFEDQSGLLETAPPAEDLNITVDWIFEPSTANGSPDTGNAEVVASDNITLDEDTESYEARYSAPSGSVLLNHYSLRLTWVDDDGRKVETSLRAFCTTPGATLPESQSTQEHGVALR